MPDSPSRCPSLDDFEFESWHRMCSLRRPSLPTTMYPTARISRPRGCGSKFHYIEMTRRYRKERIIVLRGSSNTFAVFRIKAR